MVLMVAKNARTASLPRIVAMFGGVELGDRVGVASARESGPLGIGGVDRLLGAGRGVGWGGRLTAECGCEERGNVRDESHDGSPLGEGEDDTGPARSPQAAPGGSEEGQLILLADSPLE